MCRARCFGDRDPHRTPTPDGLIEHGSSRVRQVRQVSTRSPGQRAQPPIGQHVVNEATIATDDDCVRYAVGSVGVSAEDHAEGMPGDRVDEGSRLTFPAAGEALLRPTTRRGPGLHVSSPHAAGDDPVLREQRHGIPATSHEDDAGGGVLEAPEGSGGTVLGQDVEVAVAITVHHLPSPVPVSKTVEPAFDSRRVDLHGPRRGHVAGSGHLSRRGITG